MFSWILDTINSCLNATVWAMSINWLGTFLQKQKVIKERYFSSHSLKYGAKYLLHDRDFLWKPK